MGWFLWLLCGTFCFTCFPNSASLSEVITF